MNITIHIPDNAVADVSEYCRVELHDMLQARIQLVVDTFVSNALGQMAQRREEEQKEFREKLKEGINFFGKLQQLGCITEKEMINILRGRFGYPPIKKTIQLLETISETINAE